MKDWSAKTERRNCGGLVKPKAANSLRTGQAFNFARLETASEMGAHGYSIGAARLPCQTRNAEDTGKAVGNAVAGVVTSRMNTHTTQTHKNMKTNMKRSYNTGDRFTLSESALDLIPAQEPRFMRPMAWGLRFTNGR